MERPNEIRLAQAELMLGARRGQLKRLIADGTIKAVGKGPARRVLLDSVEKSGIPIQPGIPFPEPEKQWFIITTSGECRMRSGANICGHRDNIIMARDFEKTIYCNIENCPLAVKTPCKSKV